MLYSEQLHIAQEEASKALLLGQVNVVDTRLLSTYRSTLDKVMRSLRDLYDKMGEVPTITEANKFNRLNHFVGNMTEEIGKMNTIATNVIHSEKLRMVKDAYKTTTIAITKASADVIELKFTGMPKTAVEFEMSDNMWLNKLKENNKKLVTDIEFAVEKRLRMNARNIVSEGQILGNPYAKTAKELKDAFNISATRAKMISFTEMHKAHNAGRNESLMEAIESAQNIGVKGFKVWRHNAAAKTPRPDHISADGQRADKNGLFHVGGEALTAPGLGGDPANNIYCHCTAEFEITEKDTNYVPVSERPTPTPTPTPEPKIPKAPKKGAYNPFQYPAHAYKYRGRWKNIEKGFDYSHFTPEQTVEMKRLVAESDALCEQLNIPKIRGISDTIGEEANVLADMGDGCMEFRPSNFTRFKSTESFSQMHAENVTKKLTSGQFEKHDTFMPHNVYDYIPKNKDKIDSIFWHEFGHHIHDLKGVRNRIEYTMGGDFEVKLLNLVRKHNYEGAISRYSKTNPYEFFAEHFSAHKAGLDPLLPQYFLDFLKEEGIP